MIRRSLLAGLVAGALLSAAGTAAAADIAAPVRAVMAMAEANWSGTSTGYREYFDDEALAAHYSADFAALYRASAKAAEGMEEPVFDFDPIVNAQDGCPLEDVAYAVGATSVTVTFRLLACFEGETRDAVTTVVFDVIEEEGRPVIDDVRSPGDDFTLKTVMRESAAN